MLASSGFAGGHPLPAGAWANSGVHAAANNTAQATAQIERKQRERNWDRGRFIDSLFSMGRGVGLAQREFAAHQPHFREPKSMLDHPGVAVKHKPPQART